MQRVGSRTVICGLTSALAAGTLVASALTTPASAHAVRGVDTSRNVFGSGYSPDPHRDSVYPGTGESSVDVLHYDLRLHWAPSTRTLKATAELTMRPTATEQRFTLDLSSALHVDAVAVDGAQTTYHRDGHELIIRAPTGLRTNQVAHVRIRYHGTPKPAKAPTSRSDEPTVGWHTLRDGRVWAMQEPYGAFTWYPVDDQPADKAIYTITLNVPDRWTGVSNGHMHRTHKGHRMITRFTNRDPMAAYLVTVAIGPYRHYLDRGPHHLPISYWVPKGKPSYLKPLRKTPATLRWLESKLGRYPFDRAGILVTPSQSAMETQTMITMGAANFAYGGRDVRETVAHELAHAWYGDTVTPRNWDDLWMNEGFAMYVEARYTVHMGWHTWRYWQREFARDDNYWRTVFGPPGDYRKDQFAQINVYYCTALMLEHLRTLLGATTFGGLLRAWPQTHRDGTADRDGYAAWVEHRTGTDVAAFLDRWLTSPTTPKS